jgi:hypothetical protein
MRTTWIRGVAPLSIDELLTERLHTLKLPVVSDEMRFRAAIEGPEGRIYRVLETSSLVEATRMHEILRELGLRRIHERGSHRAPLTSLFRMEEEMSVR